MSQLTAEQQRSVLASNTWDKRDSSSWRWYVLPLIVAFSIDLLTRQLVDWHLLPGAVRWISDAAIAVMIVMLLMRMLLLDRIPFGFLLILFVTVIGAVVALFEGQGVGATLYGWWRLFLYPLVGLYVYMMPTWPPDSAKWLMRICLLVLGFEVLVQLGQFATGTEPGDLLAGTLGAHGVGPLVMFILLTVSLGLGRWLQFGEWHYLAIALVLGTISSTLGEMKFYVGGVAALAILSIIVHLLRGRQLSRAVFFLILLIVAIGSYFLAFDLIYSDVRGFQFQEYFLAPDRSLHYLTGAKSRSEGGFALGRFSEAAYAWQQIQGDPTSFLFGCGIGCDATSEALGFTGVARAASFYQGGVGRSLQMFIREGGVAGLTTLAGFFAFIVGSMYRTAKRKPGSDMAAVQYGLSLFTTLWPIWLWYQPIWLQAVPMLVYWILLGFAMSPGNNQVAQEVYDVS